MTVRRLKTYGSEMGHVYEYYFVGQRRALESFGAGAAEFIFDVSSDRRTFFAISIFLLDEATADWAARHGRSLVDPERFAAAKLRLLRGFDEVEDMRADGRQLTISAEELEDLLAPLDL